MGIFLVFFPEEKHLNSLTLNSILKRTNSNHIFTRTQSTISICVLLIFLTFILFTLSSFEPNNDFISTHRRFLSQTSHKFNSKPKSNSPALQQLGTLYTRGTKSMNELVICHVSNLVTVQELKLFLRSFHRSGLASKSDLLFIFNSISTVDSFDNVIREEHDVFLKLVLRFKSEFGNGSKVVDFPASFDPTRFVKSGMDSGKGIPIWGRRVKSNNSSFSTNGDETELTRTSYGSVVGFGIDELDPENSLSGFLDNVPMSLRRWATYPMILHRVRRKFKHVILVDVKEILLLGDPLGRVSGQTHETIFLSSTIPKHGRKTNKSHRRTINPSLVLGGERGVRRLSSAMLTEIVRSTTGQHHNKKNSITESAILSQLAGNEFLQKSIQFVVSSDLIQEPSQLSGFAFANLTVLQFGNSNLDIGAVIMKHICSFSIDASVYTEC